MSPAPRRPFGGRPPAWSRVAGEASITWLETRLRAGDPSVPALNDAPRADARHPLIVPRAFAPSPDGSFWSIFTPALSHYNGWAEFPDELGRAALVRAALVEDLGAFDSHRRQVVAGVLEAVPVQELSRRFPLDRSGAVPEIPTSRRCAVRLTCGDLTLYEGNFESDLAGWLLVHRQALVLHGFSDFDGNDFCAGHRPLTAEEAQALDAAFPDRSVTSP